MFAFLGTTLLFVQAAEKMVQFCMTYVLRKQPLTLETLERQTAEEARKTLGYFFSELRKRTTLEEQFDDHLIQFLRLRNQFVHGLDTVEGLSFDTAEGLLVAEAYIGRVAGLAEYVVRIFAALMRAWTEQTGIAMSVPFPQGEYFREIERISKTVWDRLFSAKK